MDLIQGSSAAIVLIALVVAAVIMGALKTIAAEYSSAVCWYDLRVEVQRLRVEQAARLLACAVAVEEDAEGEGPRVRPPKPLPSIISLEAPAATEAATGDSGRALPTRSLLGVH